MRVERLQDHVGAHAAWDAFVDASNNGTVFQRLGFLAYHPPARFQNHHLIFLKRKRLFAVLPAAVKQEPGGPALVSHPGASYGGPVLPRGFRFEDAVSLVTALESYARDAGFKRLDLTLTPTPYLHTPHQTLEYALVLAGFGYRKREFTSIVTFGAEPEDVCTRLPAKTRADVRQARKLGLRVAWSDDPSDDDLSSLYRMLTANRADLGLTDPATHTLEELIRIRDLMPGLLLLGMTYTPDGVPVAGTLAFRCNARALLTFYICHERAYRDRHPVHLLLADLIREGAQQGYRILDFGISSIRMDPLRSLVRFKESFGAQGFFRETFEKQV